MEKLTLTTAQKKMSKALDEAIKSGNVNQMLSVLAKMMADGVTPTPKQIAKMSAHIYQTKNQELIAEFGIKYAGMGSCTQQLEDVVLENGSAEDNFDFARYVEGADIIKHGKVIKKKRNKMWWAAFVKMFPEQARIIVNSSKEKTKPSKTQDVEMGR